MPAATKRIVNSPARIVVGVPSVHSAVTASMDEPDAQDDVRMPYPTHANASNHSAWRVLAASGLTYETATRSLYSEGASGTVTSRSNACPSCEPMLRHRTLPPGSAPPVVSVAPVGVMTCPVVTAPLASVHSSAAAGLVAALKSMATAGLPQLSS